MYVFKAGRKYSQGFTKKEHEVPRCQCKVNTSLLLCNEESPTKQEIYIKQKPKSIKEVDLG